MNQVSAGPTMREAARTVVSPETIRRAEIPLTHKQKVQIKQDRVKALIKSKPAGTRIMLEDFLADGIFNNTASAYGFLKTMIKKGIIGKTEIGLKQYSYYVPDGTTIVPPSPAAPPKPKAILAVDKVEQKAMQFSWECPEHYNDLHEFVKWLKQPKPEEQTDEPS